jgi:peptidoglycan-associated lipoprotein
MGWAVLGTLCIAGALGCQTSSQMAQKEALPEPPEKRAVEPMKPATTTSEADLETVYFELDEYLLDEKARTALKKNAEILDEHPEWGKVLVEGHCDERGSEEYNLALGKRRAAEVAKYLKNLGVPAERLTTVSFGEARPAVSGESESAWKWNRRSVFLKAQNTADAEPEPDAEWTAAY